METKEQILQCALRLFARDGYDAVSVRMIAEELGITKGALYKHYENKRDIFDSIVKRMEEYDYEAASQSHVPTETMRVAEDYANLSLEDMGKFTNMMFEQWTSDTFHASFRNMLSLEQYKNDEMMALYQQYLVDGPMAYTRDIFYSILSGKTKEVEEKAGSLALEFYGPLYYLFYLYDGASDKENVTRMAKKHVKEYLTKVEKENEQ